jgi:hypothetical protein
MGNVAREVCATVDVLKERMRGSESEGQVFGRREKNRVEDTGKEILVSGRAWVEGWVREWEWEWVVLGGGGVDVFG